MTDCPIRFPAIAFSPGWRVPPKPGDEWMEAFDDIESFEVLDIGDFRSRTRETLHIIDSNYRGWRVSRAAYRPARNWLAQALWGLIGAQRYYGAFEFVAAQDMTLDQVKERVFITIDSNPIMYVDDETVAGEAGEPIEEDVLVAALKAQVSAACDIHQICEVLSLY